MINFPKSNDMIAEARKLLAAASVDEAALADWAYRLLVRVKSKQTCKAKDWQSDPPTKKQLSLLKKLGYSGPEPKAKHDAWTIIDFLKGRN